MKLINLVRPKPSCMTFFILIPFFLNFIILNFFFFFVRIVTGQHSIDREKETLGASIEFRMQIREGCKRGSSVTKP